LNFQVIELNPVDHPVLSSESYNKSLDPFIIFVFDLKNSCHEMKNESAV